MVKTDIYPELAREVRGLVEGRNDPTSLMANAASLLHERLPQASWTGFYRAVSADLLRVGPFQGPVACVEIPFGRGVCGTAASTRETQLVEDVLAFAGHIACDPAARSEIVVPVVVGERLVAVLDVDSHEPAAFGEADRDGLERIVRILAPHLV